MRSSSSSQAFVVVATAALLAIVSPAEPEVQKRDFFSDPRWEGVNNRLPVRFPPRLLQSFGYSKTNLAGEGPGEIGGYFQNTVRPAYYGKILEAPVTLDDPLSFSGTFSLLEGRSIYQWITMGCACIGFFNSREQGWRAKNFMGLRLMGFNEPDGCTMEVYYGTGDGAASGMFLSKEGRHAAGLVAEQDESSLFRIAPDARRHTFSLHYDPDGDEGNGAILFRVDEVEWVLKIDPDHRRRGAVFNRFGLFNEQVPGRDMTVYFDDLSINGGFEDFSEDPGWEASENGEILPGDRAHRIFEDPVLYGSADFGYSPTQYAGGEPGEIGGRLWRVEEPEFMGYYGDRAGELSLEDSFEARGKIAIRKFSIDTGMYIGWFDSEMGDWPPKNFVGVLMDSYTRGGRFFMPMYGTAADFNHLHPMESPFFVDDGEPMEFSIAYDPKADDGAGQISVSLGGQSAVFVLSKEARESGAVMNRFGIANMRKGNGKHCEVYLDDLEYTVAEPSGSGGAD